MESNLIFGMEVLVAVVATVTYHKYRHNPLRYFLVYLWAVVALEIGGMILPVFLKTPNLWLYNVFVILEFPLLIWWYRRFLSNHRSRRFLIWLVLIFLIFAVFNSLLFQSFTLAFQSYTFIFGAIGLIIAIFMHFNEVLHSDKILIIQRGLLFWVSVGFLFFFASVIPIMIMGNVLDHTGMIYNVFLLILNIILHCSFLIGLLWGQKKYNLL